MGQGTPVDQGDVDVEVSSGWDGLICFIKTKRGTRVPPILNSLGVEDLANVWVFKKWPTCKVSFSLVYKERRTWFVK
jgi:hypothetical protein